MVAPRRVLLTGVDLNCRILLTIRLLEGRKAKRPLRRMA
jgi:hypothetical protein